MSVWIFTFNHLLDDLTRKYDRLIGQRYGGVGLSMCWEGLHDSSSRKRSAGESIVLKNSVQRVVNHELSAARPIRRCYGKA